MSIERPSPENILPLSGKMKQFLKDQKHKAEAAAIVDAAREVGIEDFTSADAELSMELEDTYSNE